MNWSEIIKVGNFVYFKLPDDSTISRIGRIEKVRDDGSLFKIVDLISNLEDRLVSVRSNSCYPIVPTREMFDEIGFKEREYEGGRKQFFFRELNCRAYGYYSTSEHFIWRKYNCSLIL